MFLREVLADDADYTGLSELARSNGCVNGRASEHFLYFAERRLYAVQRHSACYDHVNHVHHHLYTIYVPMLQELRYFSCSFVSFSILMPMVSSFMLCDAVVDLLGDLIDLVLEFLVAPRYT